MDVAETSEPLSRRSGIVADTFSTDWSTMLIASRCVATCAKIADAESLASYSVEGQGWRSGGSANLPVCAVHERRKIRFVRAIILAERLS